MSRVVFITGVAGFIGSHLARNLLARGDRVFGLDNFDPLYDRAIKEKNLEGLRGFPEFRFLAGDIRDPAALATWGDGVRPDVLVHLAAKAGVRPSVKDPAGYADVNVVGTVRVLELARERGAPRVLFASSSSVYGENAKIPFSEDDPVARPVSPYAATKQAGELVAHAYCHLHKMNVAALRFFTVYGPAQRPEMAIHKFTRLLFEGREIGIFGDGTSRRDYTWIDDIIGGVLGAMDGPGGFRVYNLGGSRTTSLDDLVSLLERASGLRARRRTLPPEAGDVPVTFADISRARGEIGYDPKTPIEEGIQRFVDWYRTERVQIATGGKDDEDHAVRHQG